MSITITAPGQVTKVAVVKVGRPVRRVRQASPTLNELADVNVSNLTQGSVLVYSSSAGTWNSTLDLEDQNLNGGSY